MKKILTKFFILLMLSVALIAQDTKNKIPIKNINFYGIEKVGTTTVRKWFGLKKNDSFNSDALHKNVMALLQAYAEDGRPYSRLDSLRYTILQDNSGAVIDVYVREGEKIKTGDFTFKGLDDYQLQKVKDEILIRSGRNFDAKKLERDVDRMITRLEKEGHPFAKFDIQSISNDSLQSEKINIALKASSGPHLVIKEIQINGNEITKKEVILRELRIKEGDFYSYEKTLQIQSRLMKLGFFRRVEPAQVFLAKEDKGGLLINVEEGNTSKFDGVVGYSPGTGDDKGYFTGLVDISLGNLFGTGRSLLAHWQKKDKASQDMLFHYREPWVAGFPVHIGGGFQQLIQDSTYIQREYGFDIMLPLVESFSVVADLKKASILPDSMGSYQLGLPKSETVRASIGIRYDSRDDLLNPGRGIYYFTSVESGSKKNLGPQDIMLANNIDAKVENKRVFIDIDFYLPTLRRQLLSISMHGRQITSSEEFIPVPDQYRLGGTKSMRGYREDQFRGSSVAWTNVEYRYLLGPRSRAFIFFDAGYYNATNPQGVSEAFKIGYGFGFRLETGLGIMGIDYGLAYGEKQGIVGGLLHVGLVNEF
jgi:outer membrane protein insertion porin family